MHVGMQAGRCGGVQAGRRVDVQAGRCSRVCRQAGV